MGTPIELLYGAQVAGPMQVSSGGSITCQGSFSTTGAANFAGTNVFSGAVTNAQTSTFLGQVRVTAKPVMFAITSASTQFAGFVTVASGTATGTVSTTNIKSNSLVMVIPTTDTASNVAQAIVIRSLADANYFGFTVTPAPVGTDFKVGFIIFNPS